MPAAREKLEALGSVSFRSASGATVREDYSANAGDCLVAIFRTTTHAAVPIVGAKTVCSASAIARDRLCFALSLWNGQDSILKERLFGLGTKEGNHGEDVKECYFYQDSTPTHSYMKALYKYPQQAYPYEELVEANRVRSRLDPEFEFH